MECDEDDVRTPFDTGVIEMSSSDLTLGRSQRSVDFRGRLIPCITEISCGTDRVLSEAPFPICSDILTVQTATMALGAVQLPPGDIFTDGNVPAFQAASIGRLSDLHPNLPYMKTYTDISNCVTSLALSSTEVTLQESKSMNPS